MQKEKIAIIDIGSNSIRLVIYDNLNSLPQSICNEKAVSALASNLEDTGELSKEGKEIATKALARYLKLSEIYKCKKTYIIATAALRDAKDGQEFKQFLEKKYNIRIKLLSGQEEADLAGKSIIASFDNAKGICADLGGGSLELSYVDAIEVHNNLSFPVGVLRIENYDSLKQISIIKDNLNQYDIKNVDNIYLSGGNFRAIAKFHFLDQDYPLQIIHNYSIHSKELYEWMENIVKNKKDKLQKFANKESKNYKSIYSSILILKELITRFSPQNIIFSSFGIREGFLYSLKDNFKGQYSLKILSSIALNENNNLDSKFTEDLFDFIKNIIKDQDNNLHEICYSACVLSDITKSDHSEYRASNAFEKILYSQLNGFSHQEHALLATMLYFRYKSEANNMVYTIAERLLDTEELQFAKLIGYAIRLGYTISGGNSSVLGHFGLKYANNSAIKQPIYEVQIKSKSSDIILFEIDPHYEDLLAPIIYKRFSKIPELLNIQGIIQTTK